MGRKKKHEEHENHERWLVSYADFITLLFAFFTSMYAISSVNEGKFRVLSESLNIAFNPFENYTPADQQRGTRIVTDLRSQVASKFKQSFTRDFKQLKNALSKLDRTSKVQIRLDDRGVIVSISATVLFRPGSAELAPESYAMLDEIARALKDMTGHIRIEGHTDNIPINTPAYPSNWELSSARAITILRYFIDRHGFDPRKLSASGYGEFRPLVSNDTPSGRARNRRIDIILLNSTGLAGEPKSL
ncbi:MAG TPA: flagellar motor protein MotD [Deltaproteobacteria bacterium]|nr:flagellar motor protein MotD [Deltaproteobacteria bacterium]